ncbi:hypothetical protein AAG570_011304 [Ranatra chinensis]|uniref:Uncharacterized protein n=1 Tax=Ranatra chinensis TaxID=642074 RepID=A0ABD0YKJ3_9HEMI
MGGRRGDKVPVVPAQDKRICGAICLCQLTLVLSSVALVYLIVAVYWPSHRAFNSGIEPVPVMCQTVNTSLSNNCEWVSCGEWCLTKSSGFCPQINVTTRRNGTLLTLHECNRLASFPCPKVTKHLY